MNKIRFLIVLSMLLSNGIVNAQQQVSKSEARNVAINTLHNKTDVLKRSSNTEIDTVHSFSNNRSNVLMYEVVFKNRTAILLSGSKSCQPILGYYIKPEHDNGAIFDTTNPNVSCCLQNFLHDYIQELEWCFAHDSITLHYEEQWNELQKTSKQKSNSRTTIIVDSLLTTKWNQSTSNDGWICDAYNNFVTKTNSACGCISQRCPAGCVAVAIAQIMKYWNYPVYVLGKAKQFDWCNMPDRLFSYSPTYIDERNAINYLLEDCGAKTDMKYCSGGDCGSGTSDSKARNALVDDFGYSSDADLQRKFWWSDNVWIGRIKANLNQGYPVYYGGTGSGGHAFVCEGYDSDNKFRFNWGWGGSYDNGWFTLNSLTPDTNHNYSSNQVAIFYIYPGGYPNYQDYCNFTLPLTLHYAYWNGIYGFPMSIVHATVPKTATVLQSVPAGSGIPTDWHTIKSGDSAEYVAHERIVLNPGFKVEAGAHFTARIEPCASCGSTAKSTLLYAEGRDTTELDLYGFNDTTLHKSFKSNLQDEEGKVQNKNKEITLHPNPNSGTFTINTNIDPQEIISVQVFSIIGQSIYKQSGLPSGTIQMPSSTSGVFYVEILTKTEKFVRKMVVF